jgi:deoxyribose-phosphate aldolase
MDLLRQMGHEAALRLQARPLPGPGDRPQLLACAEGLALLRGPAGLAEAPFDPGTPYDLAPLIDHTLLKADATVDQVDRLCEEALAFRFASVCVNPTWVRRAAALLSGSGVRVCTVAGFPLGASTPAQKAREAAAALEEGAGEVDMVLAIGLARGGAWGEVRAELEAVRRAVPADQAALKVILETCYLDGTQKAEACRAARDAGLDFVKTSTGFGSAGATEADVALMRSAVGPSVGVKASGGIRSYAEALGMIQAGATRLGLSASAAVARGAEGATSGY